MADQEDIEAKAASPTAVTPRTSEKRHIRYAEDGETLIVSGPPERRPGHQLRRSNSSYSIHSIQSTRNRIRNLDPRVALPVQYRTASYNIEEGKNRIKAKKPKDKVFQELSGVNWHLLGEDDICKTLQTSVTTGLQKSEIKDRIAQYGRNVPSKPPSQLARKLFGYFFGGFGSILLIGGVLVFISWKPLGNPPAQANLALAIVLIVVFFIQAFFAAWQDFSSSRVMNSITGMLPEECHVLRDGVQNSILAPEVVPGDVLYFKAGDKLPADVRFVEVSFDAKFDRSILTGESLPLSAVTESTDDNYLETRCIGMQGTACTSGSGVGIVVSTGDKTVFGHIAKLTSTPNTARTPLQKEILLFIFFIVSLMITMNIIVIAVWAGYIRPYHPSFMNVPALIVSIVSVAIAFVPEGLPIALTASLTIVANIMKSNNILCKSLKTVETLGAVSVLLSDKTGTLTKNLMVVTDCLIGLTDLTMGEVVDKYKNRTKHPASASIQNQTLDQLRIVAAVCNAGEFDPATISLPLDERKIIGDATDQAVLRMSETLQPIVLARNMWVKRFDLAFNSKNKFAIRVSSAVDADAVSATLSKSEATEFDVEKDLLLMIKGAPDVLISRCSSYVGEDGDTYPLEDGVRSAIEGVKDRWSSQGKRVLLLARRVLPSSILRSDPSDGQFIQEVEGLARSNLVLVGLVGIVDPPREEIPDVVKTLRIAGIRTMMVTGDFKLTAQAIARMCGIITCEDHEIHSADHLPHSMTEKPSDLECPSPVARRAIVLSGSELITLNEHQWEALTKYEEIVFARTTPDQKLRIVKEFKARDNTVAMTGDGVNDAPSLKEADIGIAPGSGSDIAMEAADMVLLDSFSAIVEAVLYGRVIFDNLKKTITYLLPAGSFSEFWPVMTSVIFGLPQILSSFLMIIICCFTDCAAATVLAYEKPEADVLLRKPRNVKKDRLVDWRLILQSYGFLGITETLTSFSMAYWYLEQNGVPFSSLWFSYGDYNVPSGLSDDEIAKRLATASSIYFVNLVVMQWFSIMAVRTRRVSIFTHPPLFNKKTQNWYLFPAILFALVVAFIFNYIPQLQNKIGSAEVPVQYWFLPMAYGFFILSADELRKAAVRRWPNGFLARIAW